MSEETSIRCKKCGDSYCNCHATGYFRFDGDFCPSCRDSPSDTVVAAEKAERAYLEERGEHPDEINRRVRDLGERLEREISEEFDPTND